MLYRIAETLGVWDVHSLEWAMSTPQYNEWCEWFSWKAKQQKKAREGADLENRAERNRRGPPQGMM